MGEGEEGEEGEGYIMYAWKCATCHHEWQGPDIRNMVCAWCGGKGTSLGEDVSSMPSISDLFKLVNGKKGEI